MNSVKIIGISGNMGAGKTTLARALEQELNATLVCWDDFDEISKAPEDYVTWFKREGNYEEWNYPELANVLHSLKDQQPIKHPTLKTMLYPTSLVIFDAPLGRLHEQTGKYIDHCIHINIPLDVSLGRWLLRDFRSPNKTKDELLDEIDYYLNQSRPLFFDDNLKETADLIIDGLLPTGSQVLAIKAYFERGLAHECHN